MGRTSVRVSEGIQGELLVMTAVKIILLVIFVNHGKVSLLPLTTNFVFACAANFPYLPGLPFAANAKRQAGPDHTLMFTM
jgi:hypothetical protein